MKKSITLSLVLAASMGLAACGDKKAEEAPATTEEVATPEAAADGAMDAAAGAADKAGAAADKAGEAAKAATEATDAAKGALEEAKK